jgi:hypothetical protein
MENVMNFKRNIAFILLIGLIMGVLGSFSFLIGMELPAPINMKTLLDSSHVNLNRFYGYDEQEQLDYLSFNYANTCRLSPSRINSFNGIEKIMRRSGPYNEVPYTGPIHTTDSWRGKFFLHTRDYNIKSLIFDNQGFTTINGEDINHLKTIFPNLKCISLKNNKITRIIGAFNVRHLEIHLEGNPIQSIEIETPEKCNYLEFFTDSNVPVRFKQNIYSKTKTWLKSLIAKSKSISYGLCPSKGGLIAGSIVLGLYALVKLKTGPIYENVERARVIEGLKTNLVNIVPKNLHEQATVTNIEVLLENLNLPLISREEPSLLKSILSYSADGMLIGAGLLTAVHTLGDVARELRSAARSNPYRICVQDQPYGIEWAQMPSGHTYKLFGKF